MRDVCATPLALLLVLAVGLVVGGGWLAGFGLSGQIPFVGVLVLAASTLFGLGALVVELAPTLRRTSGIGADASPIAPAQ